MMLTTESVNPRSRDIDLKSIPEILQIINEEDHLVADAVKQVLPQTVPLVEKIVEKLTKDGRLFYVGAGTSGRLGIMDAAECPPTYGVPKETIQAIMAGGQQAVFCAQEDAEDNFEAGKEQMNICNICEKDIVIGLSASGRTPFVAGALAEARRREASTCAVLCNQTGCVTENADFIIPLLPGPEVIAGSTRMKAASAQKMFLNMLSTTVMIRLGKVTGNFMTSMNANNSKLRKRACFIVSSITGRSEETSAKVLDDNQCNIRKAINELGRKQNNE